MENLTLTLTIQEVNIIIESLSNVPYKVSAPLIVKIQKTYADMIQSKNEEALDIEAEKNESN